MKPLYQIINEHSLLLEYDNDTTWKQHGKKVMARATADTGDNHPVISRVKKASDENNARAAIQKHLEDTDPTPNKQYAQHIHRIYGNGGVNRLEDLHSRMKPALEKFHDLKNRQIIPKEHRDIGRIKSLGELETLVDKHSDDKSGKEVSRERSDKMKGESTIETHSTFTKVIPHTEAASKHYGCGTKWCTAGNNDNMFNDYNSRGPLHILIPHSPKYAGEKYQYHRGDNMLMNERDQPVSRDQLPHEMKKHLDLYDQHVEHAKNNPEIAKNHLEPEVKSHYVQYHAPADEVAHYRENGKRHERSAAWASVHTPVHDAVNLITNKSYDEYYHENAHKHPDYNKPNSEEDIQSELEYDLDYAKEKAAMHPHITSDHADHILRSSNYADTKVLSNPNLKDDYLLKAYKDVSKIRKDYRGYASDSILKNPNHSEATANHILNTSEGWNKSRVIRNGNLSPEKLKDIVKGDHVHDAYSAVANKNANSEVLRAGMSHPNHTVRMLSRMKHVGVAEPDEIDDDNPFNDYNWPNHPKNPDRK